MPAFACLLLSLLLVGVGELVLAWLAATIVSGIWFVVLPFPSRPSDGGAS